MIKYSTSKVARLTVITLILSIAIYYLAFVIRFAAAAAIYLAIGIMLSVMYINGKRNRKEKRKKIEIILLAFYVTVIIICWGPLIIWCLKKSS